MRFSFLYIVLMFKCTIQKLLALLVKQTAIRFNVITTGGIITSCENILWSLYLSYLHNHRIIIRRCFYKIKQIHCLLRKQYFYQLHRNNSCRQWKEYFIRSGDTHGEFSLFSCKLADNNSGVGERGEEDQRPRPPSALWKCTRPIIPTAAIDWHAYTSNTNTLRFYIKLNS